jgi:anti-sigma-K factor RskA
VVRWFGAAVLATLALAFAVAAAIHRAPPDFSTLPVIATVFDAARRPLWSIHLARAAHEIAVDAVGAAPPPEGHAYQLWLDAPDGPHSLGLLPVGGRKVIPEIPSLAARLGGPSMLLVSLEGARGSDRPVPVGPILYRAGFANSK